MWMLVQYRLFYIVIVENYRTFDGGRLSDVREDLLS